MARISARTPTLMDLPVEPDEKVWSLLEVSGINGSKPRALNCGYPIGMCCRRKGRERGYQHASSSVGHFPSHVFREWSTVHPLNWRLIRLLFITTIMISLIRPGNSLPQCQWTPYPDIERLTCSVDSGNRLFVEDEVQGIGPEHAKSLWVKCQGQNAPGSGAAQSDNPLPSSRHNEDGDAGGGANNANRVGFVLSHGLFMSMPNLRDVKLDSCKISGISPGALSLPYLQNLTVRAHTSLSWSESGSESLEVRADVLRGLHQLRHLDLSTTSLSSLPSDFLCFLPALQYLNLSSCWLADLRAFVPSDPLNAQNCDNQIRVLDLSRNHFTLLPPATFTSVGKLEVLRIQGNAITIISEMCLLSLFHLRIISLAGNQLTSLPPNLFMDNKALQEIYLERNKISVLGPGVFANLKNLLVLDLSYNELTSQWVNGETFSGLQNLLSLNLAFNDLTMLHADLFRDLHYLQMLNLEHNKIQTISENIFSSTPNLYTLVFSHNQLKKVDSSICNGLLGLSFLSLDNNQIESVEPDSFKNCSQTLEDLNLSSNKIFSVPQALQILISLRTLDLGENNITNVGNASYHSLPNLYGLRLTDNHIHFLPKDSLKDLPSLKIVNFSKNKITSLEPGVFDNNPNLQAVRLDSNRISDIKGLFKNIPNLLWLNISANQLEELRYEEFPQRLQWLDLRSNKIHTIHPSSENLRIRNLDLSNNLVTEVGSSNIPDSIENLILSNNHIQNIQPYTFYRKPNISRVVLSRNQLRQLDQNSLRLGPDRASSGLPVTEIFLGHNPLQCDCSMEWLQYLNSDETTGQYPIIQDVDDVKCTQSFDRFYFEPNSYLTVKSNQFLCKYESHCFKTCQCCDYDACDCKMTCPKNCNCYHDQAWSHNVVDCSNVDQDFIPLRIPMDVSELYLDMNHFTEISTHSFLGKKNLRVLYLNNSGIERIENNSFSGLKLLSTLHLDFNLISELHGYEFEPLENLRELYLHSNQISFIANNTFASLQMLEVLKLDGNRLTQFSVWTLGQNPYLMDVALHSNPWSCECEFSSQLKKWLIDNRERISSSEIHCVYQGRDQNKSQSELIVVNLMDQKNPGCALSGSTDLSILEPTREVNDASSKKSDGAAAGDDGFSVAEYVPLSWLVCIIIVLVIIVFIIISVVVWHWRETLKIFFHSKFGLRLGSCGEHPAEMDKLFDAFLSYSSKDEHWVRQLAEELGNYRLCLMHRDLPTGGLYLADTIVQASEASRRTILVLSHHFLKGEWSRTDVKSAHHSVLKDRNRKVIIILLGDLPSKDLDPDIRLSIKNHTCLHCDDKKLFEKLRFALPDVKVKVPGFRGIHGRNGSCRNSTQHTNHRSGISGGGPPLQSAPPPTPPHHPQNYHHLHHHPSAGMNGPQHHHNHYNQPSPNMGNAHHLTHLGPNTQNNITSPLMGPPPPPLSQPPQVPGLLANLPPNIPAGTLPSHHPLHHHGGIPLGGGGGSMTTILGPSQIGGSQASISTSSNNSGSQRAPQRPHPGLVNSGHPNNRQNAAIHI